MWLKAKVPVKQMPAITKPLKHTAIEKDAQAFPGADKVLTAGNGSGSTVKTYFHKLNTGPSYKKESS